MQPASLDDNQRIILHYGGDHSVALKDGSPEDYQQAAVRHFADASTLRAAGRLDNAGHLVGFAAECAIKHKIGTLGTGEAALAQHLPTMLPAARKKLGERVGYSAMFDVLKGDAFSDWAIDHRYSKDGKVTDEQIKAWLNLTQRLFAAANIRVRAA